MASTNSFNHSYGVPAAVAATASASTSSSTTIPPAEGAKQQMRRLDSAAPNKRNMAASHQYSNQNQQQQRDSNGSPSRQLQVAQRQSQQQQQHQQQYSDALQREDSLEYFIKFPTQNYRNDAMDGGDSDFVFVYNDSNVSIVMLLGWAGCQDRYLMKYSKIYEDRGLITVRYTAPVDTLFWKRTAMVPIGEKILKLMYDMNFDSHPVIVHIFSNGGAYLYQHISLAMRKHRTPIQIRGMIFDSAPGERRVLGLYRAVTAIYGKERKNCHCITALIITLTLSIMWFVEETFAAFKSLFFKTEPSQTNPFNDLKNDATQFPQLFVYSKGDVVIPYQDIEKFIKIRQERGVDVSAACFEDAEHVKIYTKYPSEYIHCVCSFINNCLSRPYKVNSGLNTVSESGSPTSSVRSVLGANSSKYD